MLYKEEGEEMLPPAGYPTPPYKLGLGRVEAVSRGGRRKDKTTEKDDQMKKIEDISFALTITCCLKQSRQKQFHCKKNTNNTIFIFSGRLSVSDLLPDIWHQSPHMVEIHKDVNSIVRV